MLQHAKTMAERGGFEPPVPCGTTAFEAAPINRTLASLHFALINLPQNGLRISRSEMISLSKSQTSLF